MGTTEVQAAAEGEGLEITEITEMHVAKIAGAHTPANGTTFLMIKAIPKGQARLEPPTQDGFTGPYGGVAAPEPDADDAGCGCCADCVCPPAAAKSEGVPEGVAAQADAAAKAVLDAYASIDGDWEYPGVPGVLAKRTVHADERRELAAQDQALPDGSYPIKTVDDLHNAAHLAETHHGNWKAAMKLVARMAGKLGVPNPLKKKPKSGAAKSATVADGGTGVDTETGNGSQALAKAVEDAVTKATEPLLTGISDLKAESKALGERLAKVEAAPLPGGPVLSAVRPGDTGSAAKKAGLIAKAEEQERLARTMTDPVMADRAAKAAAQYRSEAEGLD